MKSAAVISYVSKRVRKNLQDRATDLGLSLSRYVCRVLEDDCEQDDDEDCPTVTKEELEEAMRSADKLENCEVFETVEEFIESVHSDVYEACKNKSV
ncbi:MAG: hypothetical protein LBF26_02935 [Puniceicoccales bacterium]|jgi:hypothetical protein|nr:hypothetical protein [Puniceicoccales bacterium]